MKAILRFDLPEDYNEFLLVSRGREWADVLYDVDRKLRDCLKYGHTYASVSDALESIRDFLTEEMQSSNLTFDDLN